MMRQLDLNSHLLSSFWMIVIWVVGASQVVAQYTFQVLDALQASVVSGSTISSRVALRDNHPNVILIVCGD